MHLTMLVEVAEFLGAVVRLLGAINSGSSAGLIHSSMLGMASSPADYQVLQSLKKQLVLLVSTGFNFKGEP